MIYHICTLSEWHKALQQGYYEAPSLHTEGFIHCSTAQQVSGVLQRYYQGVSDLVALNIQESLLTADLKYELAPSVNEEFPHIYGRINLDAVIAQSDPNTIIT